MSMRNQIDQTDEPEEWDEAGFEAPPWLEFERTDVSEPPASAGGVNVELAQGEDEPETEQQNELSRSEPGEPFPDDHPVQFAEDLKSVYDLEESLNAYGRTIYVEEWDETTGKPKIWYEYNRQKILVRYVRRPSGIVTTYLGKTKYI